MIEMEATSPEPKNRSTSALVIFLLFVLPMPVCLFIYHFILWSTEQSAIASLSLKNLEMAGMIGLAAQAVLMTIVFTVLWRFTNDDRFKPVYAGLAGASVMAFPALLLRLIGPNNDQLGSLVQAVLCLIGAGVVILARKNKNKTNAPVERFLGSGDVASISIILPL